MNLLDRLPNDVFNLCLNHLSNSELITCLQVCKSWQKRVQKHSKLYRDIFACEEEQFKACFQFFSQKHNKELAKQVKTLTVDGFTMPKTELLELATVFPNLKTYQHEQEALLCPVRLPKVSTGSAKRNEFADWCQVIECVEEIGSPVVGPAVLAAGAQRSQKGKPCLKLTSLHISFDFVESVPQKRAFLKHLRNAPNLETLKIGWSCLFLEDLEHIHKCCPKLTRLEFISCAFQPTNNDKSKAALDATAKTGMAKHLRTLIIGGDKSYPENLDEACTFCGDAATWIRYFGKKYNLTNFVLGGVNEQATTGNDTIPEDAAMVEFISKQTNLKFYRVNPIKLSVKLLNAMDKAGIQLKAIDVCNWEASKYVDSLLKSKQMKSLETLIISGEPYSSLEYFYERKKKDPRTFLSKLSEAPNIKHLRINESKDEVTGHEDNKFPLDVALSKIPKLESITMDFATIFIEEKNDKAFANSSLRKLELIECYIIVKEFDNMENVSRFSGYYPKKETREKSYDYIEKALPNVDIVERSMDDVLPEEAYEIYLV